MKIIGGSLRRRPLERPKTLDTRPASNRWREAVFNILGDVSGLEVADLYAGSGALAIEALSRGATSAVAVEWDRSIVGVIEHNRRNLELEDQLSIHTQDVKKWLPQARQTFDLIFADPPFAGIDKEALSFIPGVMDADATLVLKFPRRQTIPQISELEVVRQRRYGSSMAVFYQRSPVHG